MTLEEFKQEIFDNIENMPSDWRLGQKVFNYIDKKFGLAWYIKEKKGIDCFYDNNQIDDFIKNAYILLYII